MSDYISREAAKNYACDQCGNQGHCNRPELCPVMDGIESVPAADVRPVVLCLDCKYWELSKIDPPFHVCTYVCGATFVREAEDFCSRGEKREES